MKLIVREDSLNRMQFMSMPLPKDVFFIKAITMIALTPNACIEVTNLRFVVL